MYLMYDVNVIVSCDLRVFVYSINMIQRINVNCNFTLSPFVLGFSALAFQPHACNDGYLEALF